MTAIMAAHPRNFWENSQYLVIVGSCDGSHGFEENDDIDSQSDNNNSDNDDELNEMEFDSDESESEIDPERNTN